MQVILHTMSAASYIAEVAATGGHHLAVTDCMGIQREPRSTTTAIHRRSDYSPGLHIHIQVRLPHAVHRTGIACDLTCQAERRHKAQ
jgi:hypothetical protein